MRILLTGGGTAGHVNPALAVADALRARDPETQFLFAASDMPRDKANDLIPRAGYELRHIHIRGMRSPIVHPANLALPFIMSRARRQARALIRAFSPDLIIGTGGFACWPVVAEGAALGIPTAVHESNALPGKAIMQVRHRVDRIFINFPETADRLNLTGRERDRIIRVGNPILPGFGAVSRADARKQLGLTPDEVSVLAFGGSLGAERLNDALVALAERVARDLPHVTLTFAAGKRDYDRTAANLKGSAAAGCPRVSLLDYIYDMPVRMAAADLVVSRAGAMTVSELSLLGKAAVLVPSPYVADNHQLRNAQALVRAGAGVCVEEDGLPGGALERAVLPLLAQSAERAAMGQRLQEGFACPDANERLCGELLRLARGQA